MFSTQLKFIDELESSVFRVLKETIGRFDFVVKDYVTNKQLFRKGIDGKEKRLAGYARTTIRIKLSKGQPVNRTTTVDEGSFHASIRVDEYEDRMEISSNVSHDKYIVKRYGKNVLRISNANLTEFLEKYFLPNLKKQINDIITK